MAQSTIEQFATDPQMPAGRCWSNSSRPVSRARGKATISEQDKTKLLDYLRKQHGAAGGAEEEDHAHQEADALISVVCFLVSVIFFFGSPAAPCCLRR